MKTFTFSSKTLSPPPPLPPFNFIKASVGPVYVPNGVHKFADENLYI